MGLKESIFFDAIYIPPPPKKPSQANPISVMVLHLPQVKLFMKNIFGATKRMKS